jgi:hypothetical protein
MSLRLVLAPLVVATLAATAHAQAPGEVVPYGPQGPQTAPADPCGSSCSRASVMANRWAVGIGVGHLTVAPDSAPDAKAEFGTGEFSLRFRATLHLELELGSFGGREQLPGNQGEGDREAGAAYLGARYRFAAEQPWNWFVMMGLGGMSIASHDATDQQRHDAQRPIGLAGIGLERRWTHFALSAELRYVGVGKNEQVERTSPPLMMEPGGKPLPPDTTISPSQEHWSGGTFSIGASYYF